jgi:hypothetical protein
MRRAAVKKRKMLTQKTAISFQPSAISDSDAVYVSGNRESGTRVALVLNSEQEHFFS